MSGVTEEIRPIPGFRAGRMELEDAIRRFGTPFFLYDLAAVGERIRELRARLHPDIRLFYAVKANPNPEVLAVLSGSADGADVASAGELTRSLDAGFKPGDLSFAGPGKTDEELRCAVRHRIGSISVESLNELERIDRIASESGRAADVSVRINPARIFKAFAIKMGGQASQFGIDEEVFPDFFRLLRKSAHCRFRGIHVYSGTQCLDAETLLENFDHTFSICRRIIAETGFVPEVLNLGGGFGIPYHENQSALDGAAVCAELSRRFESFRIEAGQPGLRAIIELGRYLIAEAGIYAARIVDVKVSKGRTYCVLDGGMNHHLAASGNLGQVIRKNYKMVNLTGRSGLPLREVTVVGPLCTSIDVIGDRVKLSEPAIGDCIAILNSGAYAYTASPLFFLSHDLPPELVIDGGGKIRPAGSAGLA
jgi:diaminopimelate decarboxylase